jgi:hypothetical protein
MTPRILIVLTFCVLSLPFAVFLRSGYANPPAQEVSAVIVCTCGKPAFIFFPTANGFSAGLASNIGVDKACRSGEERIGTVHLLYTEKATGQKCPISL